MEKTRGALKILGPISGDSPRIGEGLANARMNLEIAQLIYVAGQKPGCHSVSLPISLERGSPWSRASKMPTTGATRYPCCSGSGMHWGNGSNSVLCGQAERIRSQRVKLQDRRILRRA